MFGYGAYSEDYLELYTAKISTESHLKKACRAKYELFDNDLSNMLLLWYQKILSQYLTCRNLPKTSCDTAPKLS